MIERLSKERLEKIRQLITNPRPGSKVVAAKEAGVDLMELLENLKLTPTERVEKLQRKMAEAEREKE